MLVAAIALTLYTMFMFSVGFMSAILIVGWRLKVMARHGLIMPGTTLYRDVTNES